MSKKIIIIFSVITLILVGCSDSSQITDNNPYSVSGQILDPDGKPVPDVELLFSDGFGTVKTDENGKWSKAGLKGEVDITPVKENHEFAPGIKKVKGEEHNIIIDVTSYYVLPDTTKELTEQDMNNITVINENEIVFKNNNNLSQSIFNFLDKVKIGDILLGGVSEKTPYGFARKVTSVDKNGLETKIKTEHASIEETFKELRVKDKKYPNISKERFSNYLDNLKISNDIEVKGKLDFVTTIEGDIEVKNFKLKKFYIKSSFNFNQGVDFIAKSTVNYTWDEDFFIGQFSPLAFGPVVVTPKAYLHTNITFDTLGEASASVEFNQKFSVGMKYEDGNWEKIYEPIKFTPLYDVNTKLEATLSGEIGPEIRFILFEVLGPKVNLLSYANLEASIDNWNTKLSWSLDLGVKANAGIAGKVLGRKFLDYETGDLVLWNTVYTNVVNNVSGRIKIDKPDRYSGIKDYASGAEVKLISTDEERTVKTDDKGRYTFTDVESGEHKIKVLYEDDRVFCGGLRFGFEEEDTVYTDSYNETEITFDYYILEATVIDEETGSPIEGALVKIVDDKTEDIIASTYTKDDGTYYIPRVDRSFVYTVKKDYNGKEYEVIMYPDLIVEPNNSKYVKEHREDFRVSYYGGNFEGNYLEVSHARIQGHISVSDWGEAEYASEEEAINNITVELVNQETGKVLRNTTTDKNGYYEFLNVVPSDFTIRASKHKLLTRNEHKYLTETNDGDFIWTFEYDKPEYYPHKLDFFLAVGKISGTIQSYDAFGPISGARVMLIDRKTGEIITQTTSDIYGYYELYLNENKEYKLIVSKTDYIKNESRFNYTVYDYPISSDFYLRREEEFSSDKESQEILN